MLVIVSNRLPVTLAADGMYRASSGGLASALEGLRTGGESGFVWVGWPGRDVAPSEQPQTVAALAAQQAVPVFLTAEQQRLYYDVASNAELWPRLHALTPPEPPAHDAAAFVAYREANAAFAKAAVAATAPLAGKATTTAEPATIWLHDYHLMLAPAMVKALAPPGTRVGWFLHVPMSSIGFSSLPVATELLRGLLAADVVGFHTPASVIEFAACVARNLPDARVRPTCVVTGGASPHSCAALAAPIGIAPEAFERTASSAACQARVAELKARFAGQRLVVSVDRLDVIKGVPHRLLGIEAFLAEHSEARGAVAFVQVSVPSREDVPAVRELVRTTHELVGHVNARFGPHVHLLYGSVGAVELCALYAAADALLVTSLADGFNLVALEYVAAQAATPDDCKGALILSEFCGCAQSLCGAVRVNPYGASDISRGLAEALALPAAERLARWQAQAAYVRRHTAAAWAHGFLATLRGSGSGGDAEAGGA